MDNSSPARALPDQGRSLLGHLRIPRIAEMTPTRALIVCMPIEYLKQIADLGQHRPSTRRRCTTLEAFAGRFARSRMCSWLKYKV
jgi:hypothetical protein